MAPLSRRSLLAVLGGASAAVSGLTLGACGADPRSREAKEDAVPQPERIAYGDDPSQFGELTRPIGVSRGVVVVIHGGFWLDLYDLSLGRPLAARLAEQGWTTWNLEYRRVGSGGGSPTTLDDVAAGIDALASIDGLDTGTVVTLGHSAGGHLATWAASRGRFARWQPERVRVTHVISQAGVLDLAGAAAAGLGGGAVERFLGHPLGPDDAPVDPLQQVPLGVPVWCVHGVDDPLVPISQSETYVEAATAAGASAELVAVEGDHFVVIDPGTAAWTRTLAILDEIASA